METKTVEIDSVIYEESPEVVKGSCLGCDLYSHDGNDDCGALVSGVPIFCGVNDTIYRKVGMKAYVAPVAANTKDTNPKDAVGIKKSPLSVVPTQVIHEVGLGMLEGALKYGRHNYRIAGVRASVYYDATMRHLNQWWEGEDIDPASNLSHITKAITSLVVLRDAMLNDKCTDDRPPSVLNPEWMEDYNKKAEELLAKYPNPVHAYTKGNV
jgi:hypothetical protein